MKRKSGSRSSTCPAEKPRKCETCTPSASGNCRASLAQSRARLTCARSSSAGVSGARSAPRTFETSNSSSSSPSPSSAPMPRAGTACRSRSFAKKAGFATGRESACRKTATRFPQDRSRAALTSLFATRRWKRLVQETRWCSQACCSPCPTSLALPPAATAPRSRCQGRRRKDVAVVAAVALLVLRASQDSRLSAFARWGTS
mmetsp:Transcript_12113/g.27496  ORF Transcript_12113/g.27496 Transcript_12113/m.27496 type:complete len:202 (-) Transcript_12113:797-1402(-)